METVLYIHSARISNTLRPWIDFFNVCLGSSILDAVKDCVENGKTGNEYYDALCQVKRVFVIVKFGGDCNV